MSSELKQAVQQAIDAFDAFGEGEDDDFASLFALSQKMEALRTAIQQAGAKTDEPVAWPLRAQVWKRESTQEWVLEIAGTLGDTDMNIRHTQPLSVAYENVPGLPTFYTHPAPGVPEGFALVPLKATPKVAMVLYEGARSCFSPKVAEGLWQDALTAAQAQKDGG